MNMSPTSNRYHNTGSRVISVAALALTGWFAGPAGVAATVAADPVPSVQSLSQPATESATAQAAAPGAMLTPVQIYTAMIEAEQKRRELWRPDPAVPQTLAERWGVQVIGVHLTAGGYWLDFRFRVTDAGKAGMLFDNHYQPYLESEQTGVKLGVPTAAKVGALRTTNRQGNIRNGKIYTMMFSNPGAHVQPGHKVSVVAGDFKVEHLTVN